LQMTIAASVGTDNTSETTKMYTANGAIAIRIPAMSINVQNGPGSPLQNPINPMIAAVPKVIAAKTVTAVSA